MTDPISLALGISLGLSMLSIVVSALAAYRAGNALIEVKASQQSTHQVQFVPAEDLSNIKEDRKLQKELSKIDTENFLDIEDQQTDLDELAEEMGL